MIRKFNYILGLAIISLGIVSCGENTVDPTRTGSIKITVIDADTFDPIENATVTTQPTTQSFFTDAAGETLIENVEVGEYSVQARKDGFIARFQQAVVNEDETVNVILDLEDENANNQSPTQPKIINPANGAIDQPIDKLTLKWSASDPDGDPLTYDIKLTNLTTAVEMDFLDLDIDTLEVTSLDFETTYAWQISVKDEFNAPVLSPLITFITRDFPDNNIFFTRLIGNNLVIYSTDEIGSDEATVQITDSSDNSWRPRQNPVTDDVAFLKNVGTQIHIFSMKPDGTDVQQVTSIPLGGFRAEEIDYAWSANGDRIIYPSFDKLYMINKDGSGLTLLYQTPGGKLITECDWSSDQTFIALKVNDSDGYGVEIYTIDMMGNVIDMILSGVNGAAGGLNITVDRKQIIYTQDISGFEAANYRQLDTHIFSYDIVAASSTDISVMKPAGFLDLDPRLSPNEAELIFVQTNNPIGSELQLFRMDFPAGNNRQLLIGDAGMPDWE